MKGTDKPRNLSPLSSMRYGNKSPHRATKPAKGSGSSRLPGYAIPALEQALKNINIYSPDTRKPRDKAATRPNGTRSTNKIA